MIGTNIYFNDGDSTQFDTTNFAELMELWMTFCEENGIDPGCIESSKEVEIES